MKNTNAFVSPRRRGWSKPFFEFHFFFFFFLKFKIQLLSYVNPRVTVMKVFLFVFAGAMVDLSTPLVIVIYFAKQFCKLFNLENSVKTDIYEYTM